MDSKRTMEFKSWKTSFFKYEISKSLEDHVYKIRKENETSFEFDIVSNN